MSSADPRARTRPASVIKRDRVRIDARASARAPAQAAPADTSACAGAPRVRLIPGEGRPQAIEFTCTCGEVSLLELSYEKKP